MNVVCDFQMPGDGYRAGDGAASSDTSTPADCRASGDGGVGTDMHVVADLNEIVQLYAVFDDCILKGSTVDRCIRSNLHVVCDSHATKLRDLYPGSLVIGDSEPVRAYDHP